MTFHRILAWLVLTAALSLPASANMLQMSGATGPAGPVSGGAPVLSGTAAYPSTLTCTSGTWTPAAPPTTIQYQFFRNTSTSVQGPSGSGASTTYAVQSGDQGTSITCTAIGTNGGTTTSLASNAIAIPAASAGITLAQPGVFSQSGPSAISQATTINGTTAGHILTVVVTAYISSSTTISSVTASPATGTVTCTQATGGFAADPAVSLTAIYYCLGSGPGGGIPGGNVTITATLNVSQGYIGVSIQEWAGTLTTSAVDSGLGAACGGTFANLDCAVTPAQNGALVISAMATNSSSPTPTVTGGTLVDSNARGAYSLTSSSGTAVHHNWVWSPNPTAATAVVTAFKHP